MTTIHGQDRATTHALLAAALALPGLLLAAFGAAQAAEACPATDGHVLVAGQHHEAGTLRVLNDGSDLWIDVSAAEAWCLGQSHLAVASHLLGIPQNRSGNPIPGRFPLGTALQCSPVDGFAIALADLQASPGSELFIAYHAEVQGPSRETAWAGDRPFPGANWAKYIAYIVVGVGFESPAPNSLVAGTEAVSVRVDGVAADAVCEVRVRIGDTGREALLSFAGEDSGSLLYNGTLDFADLPPGPYTLEAQASSRQGTGVATTVVRVAAVEPAFDTVSQQSDPCSEASPFGVHLVMGVPVDSFESIHLMQGRISLPGSEVGDWVAFERGNGWWAGSLYLSQPVTQGTTVVLEVRALDAAGTVIGAASMDYRTGVCNISGTIENPDGPPPPPPGNTPAPAP